MSWRATESGQVLLDLAQHGDVAEWALWINTFGDTVYRALWGDKDTYSLAFAVAGKAHAFNQLQVCLVDLETCLYSEELLAVAWVLVMSRKTPVIRVSYCALCFLGCTLLAKLLHGCA